MVQLKKGKETNRKPKEVKGEKISNSIMDSVAMHLKRQGAKALERAIERKSDYEEVEIWDIKDLKKETTPKK